MNSPVRQWTEHSAVVDGVRIVFDESDGTGPPLVVLHGFLGSGDAMAPLLEALDALDARSLAGRRLVTVDLVGHGRSDAPTPVASYAMDRIVDQLTMVLDTVTGDGAATVDLLGYSMGGRVALALALACPDRVGRLVLVGATAGIEDPEERRARREADAELAAFADRHGIDAFVDRWQALPIFATQQGLQPEVRDRLRRGRAAQRSVGIANSLRGTGTGSMEPMWDRLARFAAPTLVLAGGADDKYCEIGARLADALPRGRLVVIDDAGHAVHVERPETTAAAVQEFLAESDAPDDSGGAPS